MSSILIGCPIQAKSWVNYYIFTSICCFKSNHILLVGPRIHRLIPWRGAKTPHPEKTKGVLNMTSSSKASVLVNVWSHPVFLLLSGQFWTRLGLWVTSMGEIDLVDKMFKMILNYIDLSVLKLLILQQSIKCLCN